MSIVLPTHNRPALLQDAVRSVLGQDVTDWELVVVDSGSDPPATVPADPRIRLVRLGVNLGPAVARNAGLAVATGEVVTFLDDDDAFTADRLRIGLEALGTAPVAVCGARFMGASGSAAMRRLDGDVGERILDGPTPCLGATTVRAECCLRFDERWRAVEDVDWWRRLADRHPVCSDERIGYLVRKHDGPRSLNDTEARIRENLELLDAEATWFRAHPRAAAFRLRRTALLAASTGDRSRARRLLLRSLRRRPTVRSGWHLLRTSLPGRR